MIGFAHPDDRDFAFGVVGDVDRPLFYVLEIQTASEIDFLDVHAHVERKLYQEEMETNITK